MEDAPVTIAGQVISLHDRGYSVAEIAKELLSRTPEIRVSRDRVRAIIRRANSQSGDSRRLFEIYEMLSEALAILREIKGMDPARVAARMRALEIRSGLSHKLGAAITKSESMDTRS